MMSAANIVPVNRFAVHVTSHAELACCLFEARRTRPFLNLFVETNQLVSWFTGGQEMSLHPYGLITHVKGNFFFPEKLRAKRW
jgi:hypothetical protein